MCGRNHPQMAVVALDFCTHTSHQSLGAASSWKQSSSTMQSTSAPGLSVWAGLPAKIGKKSGNTPATMEISVAEMWFLSRIKVHRVHDQETFLVVIGFRQNMLTSSLGIAVQKTIVHSTRSQGSQTQRSDLLQQDLQSGSFLRVNSPPSSFAIQSNISWPNFAGAIG